MVMPSGWRISTPAPVASISGSAPKMAAMVVIMMGRKRVRQAWKIASRGASLRALGLQREVHHHDGVFLDDADQQEHADQRDQREVLAQHQQGQQRARPADGSVDRMVSGCTKLSYRMPSTIYMVTRAARISQGCCASVCCRAAAVPWKPAWI